VPRNISPFKLGLFIVICGSIGLIALIWLGASHFFEERKPYVSYFNESVKGLQAGANVNYRGVPVGRVNSIGLAPDGRLIQVLMDLNPTFRVSKSLAIQLRPQGLTGLSYLEIDKAPADLAKLTPHLDFPLKYPLIPSYPSELALLKSALMNIYEQISSLDLKAFAGNWSKAGENANQILLEVKNIVESKDWQATAAAARKTVEKSSQFMDRLVASSSKEGMKKGFADLSETLGSLRQVSENLSAQVKAIPPGALASMTDKWNSTLSSGTKLFSGLDQGLSQSVPSIQQSLQQLTVLLTRLNQLVQSLKEQPNRLIFSPKATNPFERKHP
jgi:ABC-type transporter Mla subunit MlaD